MNTEYDIIDNYGYSNYEYLNEVIDYAIKKLDIKNSIFDIIFIDDTEMHKLNKEYRGIDRTTDVLSFALNDNKHIDTFINSLGDIFISIPKMKSQAVEYGHSEKRELSFLALHGLLHLLGYDHTLGKKEEEEMFGLQKEILNDLGI
mgnify:FL=1